MSNRKQPFFRGTEQTEINTTPIELAEVVSIWNL